MLKQRVLTALVVAGLLLAAVFTLSPESLALVFALVVLLAAWGWAALSGLKSLVSRGAYLIFIALTVAATARYCGLYGNPASATAIRDVLVFVCTWWALALLWVLSYPGSAMVWGSRLARGLIGVPVLIGPWLGLVWLRDQFHGEWLLIYLVLIVCSNDIAAYFSGRAWGGRKLLPSVSPGKTWAGLYGGIAGSMMCAVLFGLHAGFSAKMLFAWVVVAAIATVGSILGDLVESMVKRHRGVKDSGRLLPGHGGILDRIDSITAAAPIFALAAIVSGVLPL